MLHKAQVSSWRLRLHLLAQIDRSQVYTSSLRSIWSAGLDFKLLMAIPVKFLLLAQTIMSQSELIILFSQCSSAVHGTDVPWAWKAKLQSSFTISLPSSSVSIQWIPKSPSYDHILNPGPQCIFFVHISLSSSLWPFPRQIILCAPTRQNFPYQWNHLYHSFGSDQGL